MRSAPLIAVAIGIPIGLFAPLFIPGLSRSANAGTALSLSLDEAFMGSDLVIEGHVRSRQSGSGGQAGIYTDWVIDVDRTFWGESQETRTIRLPGGVLSSGKGMVIPGMPRLVEGEHVLLMLEGDPDDGMCMPRGLSQGKYRIVTSADGTKTAIQTGDHVSVVSAHGAMGTPSRRIMDYADMVARFESMRAQRRQSDPSGR